MTFPPRQFQGLPSQQRDRRHANLPSSPPLTLTYMVFLEMFMFLGLVGVGMSPHLPRDQLKLWAGGWWSAA